MCPPVSVGHSRAGLSRFGWTHVGPADPSGADRAGKPSTLLVPLTFYLPPATAGADVCVCSNICVHRYPNRSDFKAWGS